MYFDPMLWHPFDAKCEVVTVTLCVGVVTAALAVVHVKSKTG